MTEEANATLPEGTALTVKFLDSDDLPILYATNMILHAEEHSMVLALAQVFGPYESPLKPETIKKLKAEGIEGKIVAKIAIPMDRFGEMLQVFEESYTKWLVAHQGESLDLETPT